MSARQTSSERSLDACADGAATMRSAARVYLCGLHRLCEPIALLVVRLAFSGLVGRAVLEFAPARGHRVVDRCEKPNKRELPLQRRLTESTEQRMWRERLSFTRHLIDLTTRSPEVLK